MDHVTGVNTFCLGPVRLREAMLWVLLVNKMWAYLVVFANNFKYRPKYNYMYFCNFQYKISVYKYVFGPNPAQHFSSIDHKDLPQNNFWLFISLILVNSIKFSITMLHSTIMLRKYQLVNLKCTVSLRHLYIT